MFTDRLASVQIQYRPFRTFIAAFVGAAASPNRAVQKSRRTVIDDMISRTMKRAIASIQFEALICADLWIQNRPTPIIAKLTSFPPCSSSNQRSPHDTYHLGGKHPVCAKFYVSGSKKKLGARNGKNAISKTRSSTCGFD